MERGGKIRKSSVKVKVMPPPPSSSPAIQIQIVPPPPPLLLLLPLSFLCCCEMSVADFRGYKILFSLRKKKTTMWVTARRVFVLLCTAFIGAKGGENED